MRILSFSSSFPSRCSPTEGVFVYHRLAAMAEHVVLEVVHPVPVCPLVGQMRYPAPLAPQEQIGSLTVYHRSFAYIPRLLKRYDARFYAAGLYHWVRDYCARNRPDLLDGHFAWPDGVGVSYLARRLGLPYTITLRGTIIPRYRIPCFRWRMADALSGAAAVISVSSEMAQIAVELGVDVSKVHVIPNGVDTEAFRPMPREEARRQLGLSPDGRLIVCVASLKFQKGIEDVLAAMAKLCRPDVRLIFVGGRTERGAYIHTLQRMVRESGLQDRVAFTGEQPQERIAIYFNAADVSVLASHNEGCPNVVLESLACGTPVVATAVGAVPDIIRSGQNGELVPVRNRERLASALALALSVSWSTDAIRASVSGRTWPQVAQQVMTVMARVARPTARYRHDDTGVPPS